MKLIIFGGRGYSNYERVKKEAIAFIKKYWVKGESIEIVSGACSDKKRGVLTYTRPDGTEVFGADGCGERFAAEYGFPCKLFPAEWNKFGKAAGPIRNGGMGAYGTHALGFPGGKGTSDMAKIAEDNYLVGHIVED
jgi:hypothetical protein